MKREKAKVPSLFSFAAIYSLLSELFVSVPLSAGLLSDLLSRDALPDDDLWSVA